MSFELVLGLLTLFGTAAIGMPVAYAIIIGVLVYLGLAGQDLAIAGETMVQRLFDGFLLLAVLLCLCKYYECGIDLGPSAAIFVSPWSAGSGGLVTSMS